jgi:hypothetical protein
LSRVREVEMGNRFARPGGALAGIRLGNEEVLRTAEIRYRD